jgi:endonuclease/exonuclease/phosphatase family metal-dependent hydrolase
MRAPRASAFLLLLLLFLLLLLTAGCRGRFTILCYNVQNLFDDVDHGTEYSDYDPGRGSWGSDEVEKRLQAVAEAVRRSTFGGPDVLALQEVENLELLNRLCDGPLRRGQYLYRALVPVEGQAFHCAIASRYPIGRVGAWHPEEADGGPQRAILEAEIELPNGRLFLFNAHWKSKLGGIESTEEARRASAAALGKRLTAVFREDPTADVVVAGDLNENLREPELEELGVPGALSVWDPASTCSDRTLYLTAEPPARSLDGGCLLLYEPWFEIDREERWSYVYRGRPQTPDHVLLSAGLFDGKGLVYRTGGFRVIRPAFLLGSPTGHPVAAREDGSGYSDHLPLLLRLRIAPAGRL